ncbi:MAG: methylmalonyl-CoA mutase family protein [Deltaproteobacteria bacterium]|nr:MAG: methylmalonyl-CoA mutase family protein [Deltaproteobacteria bacterium]
MEKQFKERLPEFTTLSSKKIERVYNSDSIAHLNPEKDLGEPGEYPFTRGAYPTMYRGRHWTMRQFAGFGTAADTNERFHYLLNQGQTGLSTAFHFPTLMGVDSDSPRARGEVGVCGVAIDTLHDMEVLFKGINLENVSTSMTINTPAPILLAMYLEVAAKQNFQQKKLSGTVQNDVLKDFIAQKTWIYPPAPAMRLCTDLFDYCQTEVPRWHPVSISGYHIREAGSTAAQELAFTLRDGIEYVDYCVKRGMKVDEFGPKLSFFFNAQSDFFEEIAKYRAARRIWARTMKERFGATNPEAMRVKFHTQTAGCSLTAQQPMNNVVRTTLQALSGVLGGTQSLHTNSLDETLALPTEASVRIALRTQQIIAYESGVTNTVDPFAGSYFVEKLTDDIEREALAYFKKIDDMGGMVRAIELGYPQKEIIEAAYRYQKQLETKEKIMVGVQDFVIENEPPIDVLRIDPQVEQRQIESTRQVKAKRNNAAVKAALSDLKKTAEGSANLIPNIRNAVREYATLGEMIDTMKEVFGAYKDPGHY